MIEKKQQLIEGAIKAFEMLYAKDKTVTPEDGLVWAMEDLGAPDYTHEEYESLVHSVIRHLLLQCLPLLLLLLDNSIQFPHLLFTGCDQRLLIGDDSLQF